MKNVDWHANKQTNKQTQLTFKQKGNNFEIHKIFKNKSIFSLYSYFFQLNQTYSRLPIQ